MAWWAERIEDQLSQGDILTGLVMAPQVAPLTGLSKEAISGGRNAWVEGPWSGDTQGHGHCLAKGPHVHAIVVSHSCEVDKGKRKKRVLVAPVREVEGLQPTEQEKILAQRSYSQLPLPDIPQLGTCYADFRLILPLEKRELEAARRIASMSEEARSRLHAQLVAFFTRLSF